MLVTSNNKFAMVEDATDSVVHIGTSGAEKLTAAQLTATLSTTTTGSFTNSTGNGSFVIAASNLYDRIATLALLANKNWEDNNMSITNGTQWSIVRI